MRTLAAALLLALTGTALAARPNPAEEARALVLKGEPAAAVTKYALFAGGSEEAAVVAEYGWALAKACYPDLALARLDRALQLDATNADVLYYASSVLASLGLSDAAAEIRRPAPAWLSGRESLPSDYLRDELGELKRELNAGTGFLVQTRYLAAADRFHRLTKKFPDDRRFWKGYAIALEAIGAYQSAARAVAKDMGLSETAAAGTRELLAAHKAALEGREPLKTPPPARANEMLKGRYLSFFGGSVNHTAQDTVINLNARAGKFLTNRIDAAVNLGLISGYDASDYNGLTFGVSGRYLHPLPVAAPLSAALGARLQYLPAPSDRTSLFLAPGLSYFLPSGSVDLTLDWALSGAIKGTKTLSLGYTVYFGGRR